MKVEIEFSDQAMPTVDALGGNGFRITFDDNASYMRLRFHGNEAFTITEIQDALRVVKTLARVAAKEESSPSQLSSGS